MNLTDLLQYATDKKRFNTIKQYIDFCAHYLEYIETALQARIVSQNESHYQFFQYREEGHFNVTRPLNSCLMYNAEEFDQATQQFMLTFEQLRNGQQPSYDLRNNLIRTIYTLQQSIGAALDGLPAGKSNQARKINGDLFEHLIRLLIISLNIECVSGIMQVPVKDLHGTILFKANYQHDLLLHKNDELKIIGSVKTSSKDRLDKVFMDKFLYNRLTDTDLPHIAIFLNDVQRKNTQQENKYRVSGTFLPGHFRAYTIKLNALDGVYYCDIRPNMINDDFISQHVRTIDNFFFVDLWKLLNQRGPSLREIAIKE